VIGGIAEALAFGGLPLLLGAVAIAGVVRGFTGFGTALIYVPLASSVLPPVQVVVSLIVFDLLGTLPLLPRAARDGSPREVVSLMPATIAGLAAGLWVLTRTDPVIFRWVICVTALGLLAVLASGWRYRGDLGAAARSGVGAAAGFCGGVSGAAGPPVILFYMGGPRGTAPIRANILLFLVLTDVIYLALLGARGLLDPFPVAVGLMLIIPYALGGLIGQAVFDPTRERLYRGVSYAVIASAALVGLPVFG
jgi:uncharacterized membrane protein YfcA